MRLRQKVEIRERCSESLDSFKTNIEATILLQSSTNDNVRDWPLDIVVEEIHIQTRLDYATNIHNPIVFVMRFVVRSVHPVHYVQSAVGAKKENVMA